MIRGRLSAKFTNLACVGQSHARLREVVEVDYENKFKGLSPILAEGGFSRVLLYPKTAIKALKGEYLLPYLLQEVDALGTFAPGFGKVPAFELPGISGGYFAMSRLQGHHHARSFAVKNLPPVQAQLAKDVVSVSTAFARTNAAGIIRAPYGLKAAPDTLARRILHEEVEHLDRDQRRQLSSAADEYAMRTFGRQKAVINADIGRQNILVLPGTVLSGLPDWGGLNVTWPEGAYAAMMTEKTPPRAFIEALGAETRAQDPALGFDYRDVVLHHVATHLDRLLSPASWDKKVAAVGAVRGLQFL